MQNRNVPTIHALPPELLSYIFLLCHPISYDRNLDFSWVRVTEVCQLWRRVALACPAFWANIILDNDVAPLMLARSKAAPLSFYIDLNEDLEDPADATAVSILRENAARMGDFSVLGRWDELEQLFSDMPEAPLLKNVSIVQTYASGEEEVAALWLDFPVFGSPPRTIHPRMLVLHGCALRWDSGWYSNLSELELVDLHISHNLTLSQLLAAIKASPALEDLKLMNTNTVTDTTTVRFHHRASHLRSIFLSEPILLCDWILDMHFPRANRISVAALSVEHRDVASQLVDEVFRSQMAFQYRTLRIMHTRYSLSGEKCLKVQATSNMTKRLDLVIEYDHPSRLVTPLLQTMLDFKKDIFSSLTELSVNFKEKLGGEGTQQSWDFFCRCRCLKTLKIWRSLPTRLLLILFERAMRRFGMSCRQPGAFEESVGASSSWHAWEQILPCLETLHLHDLQIDVGRDEDAAMRRRDRFMRLLVAFIWARWACRKPVIALHMSGQYGLFLQEQRHLERLVETVSWKGEVLGEGYWPNVDLHAFAMDVFEENVTEIREIMEDDSLSDGDDCSSLY